MAQLKDLIVNGASRFIGDIFGNKAQLTTLDAPETAGGSTYGPGTSGQVLKTNGTSIYWGADNNSGGTVTSVRVQATSPVVSSVNTAQTGTLNTTISLADGYGDTKNPYASKTANYVLAAPNGSNGVPTFRPLVIADIPGLSNAMHFIGITTTALEDGDTTATLEGSGLSKTTGFVAGDVVIDSASSYEYVWTGSAWEALGPDGSYKILQTAISNSTGTADGTNKSTSFIYSFSQNANGELSAKTRELDTSGTWSGNAATATTASKLSNTSKIGDTNKPVYFTADGTPAAISYTIDKSVPSTAVFTDRYVNTASFAHDSTNNNIKMTLTRAGSDTATVTANIPKISKDTAGVVPKGTEVSSQSQTTKFLREDGTWAAPSYTTNTNTTYTFAEGSTNGAFSVTPSGGSAQSVPIHGLNGAAYKAEDYYVKRSGDTITGNINRYYSATSTDPMITALANNKDIFLFEVGHGTQAGAHAGEDSNYYQLKYVGTGTSPNNYLQLIASTGTDDIVALQFNENGNAIFNGATRFAIGDNDQALNKRFIIGSSGKRYLSFGGAGIQAYDENDSVSQLYLNYNGGVVSAGSGGFTTGNITIGGGASGTNEGKTIASSSTLYLTTLASSSIILGINSTNKIRLDTSGYFRPESDGSSQLGVSGTRWAKLFVGATDSYGSSNAPIYWNNGVPEQVNLNSTANNLLNALTTGSSTPVDADYYISQYVGGGTTTITYHRRPMSALWDYINGKITSNRITTATQYGVAYYSSTAKINSTAQGTNGALLTGKGANAPAWKASANGAVYATSANGDLQWGTLPTAQGGTSATTQAGAFTNIVAPGGAMTGPLSWTNSTALPAATSAEYFLTIDAFEDGGKTKYITKANAIKSLVSSSAIGSGTQPIYWTGTAFSATDYALKATVNDGAANYLAYYSGTNAISRHANAHWSDAAGTTSTVGRNELVLGNGTASGTANNAYGRLALYSQKTKGTYIVSADNTTDWYTATLQAKTGTIAYTADITTAIQALDVSAAGATDGTKYIAAISETDGKISATAVSVATTYSSTGTTAISGTGVLAALQTLDVSAVGVDAATGNKYICKISETDGKISATLSTATLGGQYLPVRVDGGVIKAITENSVLTDLGSTTAASTYAASPRPGITGTLAVGHGGTGNTSYTANRVIYSESASKLSAHGSLIINTAVTYSSRPITPLLRVNGILYADNSIESNNLFVCNRTTVGGGYYVQHNNVNYGQYCVNALGTAAVSDGAATPTYTNTTGEGALILGNNKQGTSGNSGSVVDNARGALYLYGAGTKYTKIIFNGTGTSGHYTQGLPMMSGNILVGNTTVAATMGDWTAANWNRYSNTYLPTCGADGIVYYSDVAQIKIRLYAAAASSGYSGLELGNNIAQGTAKNCYGYIRLYTTNTGNTVLSGAYGKLDGTNNVQYFNVNTAMKATAVWGGVWNDYAEFRKTDEVIEAGRCIRENGDDTLKLTTQRLERGCEIVSDTYGFAIGATEECKTPIASSGRVLAYGYESREEFASHIGWPVCSGPNGTVSIMTEEEEEKYPSRIIGTISAVPDYEEWGEAKVKINGRVWIRIR